MIWVIRGMLFTGLVLMAWFDVTNNFVVLGSGVGALAFTWTSVALSMTSGNVIFLVMAGCCAALSGSYNLKAQISPNVEQKEIRGQISRYYKKISELESSLYTQKQITDCYNDIVDGVEMSCKSEDYRRHNERVIREIAIINGELSLLKSKKDIRWQPLDTIGEITVYGTAFFVPFSLAFLAAGIRGTFNSRKSKPLLERLKLYLNRIKTDSNASKTVSNQTQIDYKQVEREKILHQAYIKLGKKLERDPKVKELFEEVKREQGLSAYKYTRDWFNSLTEETKPYIHIKKETKLNIIRPTSGGQIV